MKSKVTVGVFLLLLFGLALLNLLSADRPFSENENRYLKQRPALSLKTVASGKWMEDFDEYVTDQFVARDVWVGAKTLAERWTGKRSSGGVYFAADNYLIEMFEAVDEAQWEKNLGYAADFSQQMEEGGVEVHTLLVPTASWVLADKLPAFAPELDQRALLARAGEQIPGLVDISDVLRDHREEYIYYRTDHHWTSLGAYYGYEAWREETGREAASLGDFRQEILSESFFGTTYSKANLYTATPDTMTAFLPVEERALRVDYNEGQTVADTIYETSYLDKKDKYSTYLNANQSITRIDTGSGSGGTLLLIKDSYANTFVQMLLGDYETILVIDLRYYKTPVYELIREQKVDEVLILYNLKGFAADNNIYFLTRE